MPEPPREIALRDIGGESPPDKKRNFAGTPVA